MFDFKKAIDKANKKGLTHKQLYGGRKGEPSESWFYKTYKKGGVPTVDLATLVKFCDRNGFNFSRLVRDARDAMEE